MQKTFIQDCALRQATERLSHPYRREHSPATVIAVRNSVNKSVRGQLDEVISPEPKAPHCVLFRVVDGCGGHTLPKTPEQHDLDTEIALEIEKKLNLKKTTGSEKRNSED